MVENDLYGVVLDNMADLEMAIGLWTARTGAALIDTLGRARANDLNANILTTKTSKIQQNENQENA